MIWRAICVCVLWPGAVVAQDFQFEWSGSGGYAMRGAVSFGPNDGKRLLTEADVQCFEIEGFHNGDRIGRWALGLLTEDTTWQLMFDPGSSSFVTAGPELGISQAWNMNGTGNDCGVGGFGFNLGSFAQDICLDNTLIVESQVPPPTPFPAFEIDGYVFGQDACLGVAIVSRQMR